MDTYIGELSYLAISPEVTAGIPVIPANFVPLVAQDIQTVVNHVADRRMKGIDWKANDLLRGNRSHEGSVTVLGDPDTLGHILNMIMAKGTTTGSAPAGYTHPFAVGNAKSYTIDIKKGNYVQRYYGVKIDEISIEFKDGQMELAIAIKAMGQFSIGSVGIALSGAVTSLVLDDEYDIAPTRGLLPGDVITVGGEDLTILTVDANETTITFASGSVTAPIGSVVLLKPQNVSFATLQDPFYFGNLWVGIGANEAAATTAAGSRDTATPVYDMKITFKTNLFAQNGTNRMDPVQIITRTKEAQLELKQLFTGPTQRRIWMDRAKQAVTLVFWGKYIDAAFTIQEKLTLKFYNVKLIENLNDIKIGELVFDEEQFEVLYDNAGGVAITATLVNRTPGTVY